ncbi:1,4-dihydroxy-2-naphthoate octaprenyltransferase [Halogeometricum limi]|uniref:1,4-dihydroxy-2-naphthoate octaprenyltransferase n=2 Tax=Halogeometricum limi TaxID=555875 RepID=A0A1I6HXS5_9EURY|nr:1,4-dihydroxy-2-naphthoate octaprenyltransferase [Halogeometricum limi]
MSRPEQVLLMAVVYSFGGAVAVNLAPGEPPSPTAFALSFLAFVPTALAIHYANEYADYETDVQADRTPFSGGSGALSRTGLSPELARRAMVVSGGVGVVAAVAALLSGVLSLPAFVLLVVVGVVGVQYSIPPLRLVWRGYGEVTNAVLGGLLLPAYGYAVVSETVPTTAAATFLPFAVLVFSNLLATHWPDRAPDGTVGKRTLSVRWSSRRLRRTYWLSLLVGYGSHVLLGVSGLVPWVVVFAGLPALPFSVWGGVRYTRVRSPLPAVAAMVVFVSAQTLVWVWLPFART